MQEAEVLQLREDLLKLHMVIAEQPDLEVDYHPSCHQASDVSASHSPTDDRRSSPASGAIDPLSTKRLSLSSDTGDERPVCERSNAHTTHSPEPPSIITSGPPSAYHTSSDSVHDHRFHCISERSSISETGASSSLNSPWYGSAPNSKPPSLGDSRLSSTSAEYDPCQFPNAYKRVHTVGEFHRMRAHHICVCSL